MKKVLLVLAFVLSAAQAFAQVPNYLAQVEACAVKFPDAYNCAHVDSRNCKADFVIFCARDIQQSTGDTRLGVNWKRGNVGDLSLDVFAYKGGPTTDRVNGGGMSVIDILSCAGGDPGVCSQRPAWQVHTASDSPVGAWVDPFSVNPSAGGGSTTPPAGGGTTNPPASGGGSVNLGPVLDKLAGLDGKLNSLQAEVAGLKQVVQGLQGDLLDRDFVVSAVDRFGRQLDYIQGKTEGVAATADDTRRRLEDVVQTVNLISSMQFSFPEYKGSVLGFGVTLRPVK